MIKIKLREIVEDTTTKKGKYFDYFIQLIIILSLISFSLETLPNISEDLRLILEKFELISIIIFSVEYLLRVLVSKKPFSYIFSFYGVIDILAILPFYLNRFLDLRFLRAFRVFRIFRALKLIRYNKALNRFNVAFKIVKEELVLFFIVILIMLFIVSAGIYSFENEAQPEVFKSVFHSAWWSIVTLTTVGYGGKRPHTTWGKCVVIVAAIFGAFYLAMPLSIISSKFDKNFDLESVIKSSKVDIKRFKWEIYQPTISTDNKKIEYDKNIFIETHFNQKKINSLYRNLSSLTPFELLRLKKDYESIGYSTNDILLQLHRLASFPFYLTILTLLMSIIMLNTKRDKPVIYHIILGVFLSVVIYYFYYLFNMFGKNNTIPILTSVWLPLLILVIFIIIGLIRINEK